MREGEREKEGETVAKYKAGDIYLNLEIGRAVPASTSSHRLQRRPLETLPDTQLLRHSPRERPITNTKADSLYRVGVSGCNKHRRIERELVLVQSF